jgi:proteasome lid subunit RPN8/RPN11
VLAIAAEVLDRVVAHARRDAPREACGLMAADAAGVVVLALPVSNAAAGTREFLLDAQGELAAFERIDAAGLEFAGVYHSHPQGGVGASAADVKGALLSGAPASVIVALLEDGSVSVSAFGVADGGVAEMVVRTVG